MPHYVSAGNTFAHGLIIATLAPGANARSAMAAVTGMRQGSMTVVTVSYFEKRQAKGNKPSPGNVLALFANSANPIQDTTAHDDMDDLVSTIRALPDFTGDVDHW